MSRYVLLPNINYSNDYVFILINDKKLIKELKIRFNKNIIFIYPNELLCKKWSMDLLREFGDNHILPDEKIIEILSYYKYLGMFYYACDCFYELKYNYDDFDIYNFLKLNKYSIIIPHIKFKFRCPYKLIFKKNFNIRNCLRYVCNLFLVAPSFFRNHIIYINGLKRYISKQNKKKEIYKKKLLLDKVENVKFLSISETSGATFFEGNYLDDRIFIKCNDYLETIIHEKNFLEDNFKHISSITIPFIPVSKSNLFCAYKFVDCKNLTELNKLSKKEQIRLVEFLLNSYIVLKTNEINFNDIRPENVVFDKEHECFYLCDWGWAFNNNAKYDFSGKKAYFYKQVGHNYRYSKDKINDYYSILKIIFDYCDESILIEYGIIEEILKNVK